MAKYSIVELAVSNGNLVGVDQLSNNQKRALELNNAIYIYRGTRSKKVYIGQTMHFIERHKLVLCQDLVQVKMRTFSPF